MMCNIHNNDGPIKEIVDLAAAHENLLDARHCEVLLEAVIDPEIIKANSEAYIKIYAICGDPVRSIQLHWRSGARLNVIESILIDLKLIP
jgi:hypothetical protein